MSGNFEVKLLLKYQLCNSPKITVGHFGFIAESAD